MSNKFVLFIGIALVLPVAHWAALYGLSCPGIDYVLQALVVFLFITTHGWSVPAEHRRK
jgi:hypothetical protein